MLVDIEARESVRVIRMKSEPENRFNAPFVAALNQALDAVEADAGARSVVLASGFEKYFSNGLDLNWLIPQPRPEWGPFLVAFDRLLHRVFVFPRPVVAAINGHAFAGGLFLALCADWRVMRQDRGWLCVPEVDLGLDLPPGNVALIAHAVGDRRADYLALTAMRLTAKQALGFGMVDEIAAAAEVEARAVETAKKLSAKKTDNYARIKRAVRAEPARLLAEADPPFILALVKDKTGLA